MSPGIREGTGNGSCGIPVRLKMRLQALCLCAILGLPSIVVTLTLFVITQVRYFSCSTLLNICNSHTNPAKYALKTKNGMVVNILMMKMIFN